MVQLVHCRCVSLVDLAQIRHAVPLFVECIAIGMRMLVPILSWLALVMFLFVDDTIIPATTTTSTLPVTQCVHNHRRTWTEAIIIAIIIEQTERS